MKQSKRMLLVMTCALLVTAALQTQGQTTGLQSPESYFGFQPGSDGNLFNYSDLIGYLRTLEEASDRIHLEEIGTSPMGKKMYIAFISASANIANLDGYKKINRELALNPELSEAERENYFSTSKVFVLSTLFMHSTEVGPTQAAPLVAYDLVTTEDEKKLAWLDNVVLMMVPCHNYYILPRAQHDPGELVALVDLLQEHGITLYQLEKDFVVEDIAYKPGDLVIPLAQPFRAFIKEVMEVQEFPERHYTPGGELIKPYDITSWSLPLHRNVKSFEVNTRVTEMENHLAQIGEFSLQVPLTQEASSVTLPVTSNASFQAVFALVGQGISVERLTEKVKVNGKEASAGSFLVSLDGKEGGAARQLVEELRIPVIPVEGETGFTTAPLEMPRIALVETYFHDMDAGWTRYVFDSYHIPYTKIRPHEIADARLSKSYDVVIFPDENKDLLMEGKYKRGEHYYQGNYYPDVAKGMRKEGKQELIAFLDQGGLIISWGQSTALFEGTLKTGDGEDAREFILPFNDFSAELNKSGLYVPGSLVKIGLLENHPLTFGMPAETGVFSRGRPVFNTSLPGFDMDRRVIASYPEKEILLSGYAAEEEKMGNKAAMIWLKKGEGQLVLFGFNPQFRSSTQGTFKLLFNALLL